MSLSYYVDEAHADFRVKTGKLLFVRGVDSTVQQIRIALLTEFGEWYLNINKGVPYYSTSRDIDNNLTPGILGGQLSAAEISAIIRFTILSVPNVVSVDKIDLQESDNVRSFTLSASCSVQSGTVNSIGTQNISEVVVNI